MTVSLSTLGVPVGGAGAALITRSLRTWRTEGRKHYPEIINAWQGTDLDPALQNLWTDDYAEVYHWVRALQVTKKLWEIAERLVCEEFADHGTILDIGAGDGFLSRKILEASEGATTIVFDWSLPFLERAQENLADSRFYGRLSIWWADATKIPWPWQTNSLGGGVLNYVLPYLPEQPQITILREAHRALMPGSGLIVSFMRAGTSFKDIIKYNLLREFLANPYVFFRSLLYLVRRFTKKADAVSKRGLTHYFSDEEFLQIVLNEIGYRKAELVSECLPYAPGKNAFAFYRLTV